MNRTLAILAGASIGGIVGTGVGSLLAISGVVMDLTAPVSYPILGAISGGNQPLIPNKYKGFGILGGMCGGACLIPLAPINLCLRPFIPVMAGLAGAVGGGIMGYKK